MVRMRHPVFTGINVGAPGLARLNRLAPPRGALLFVANLYTPSSWSFCRASRYSDGGSCGEQNHDGSTVVSAESR